MGIEPRTYVRRNTPCSVPLEGENNDHRKLLKPAL